MAQQLELLAPAGTFEIFQAVIHAGADAVYFGGSRFGARAYAGNLDRDEACEAIDFAHIRGRKAYLAVNTLLKEREMEEQLYDYLLPYYERGLDAVIAQDFGVMRFVRNNFKGMRVHASTQMSVAGAQGARLLEEAGAARIVLARELSLDEIEVIHREVAVELESFAHGALCYSYSGQCLFSSMLGGRSGNRGRCAQPCRLSYDVYDDSFARRNGRRQNYPLSPKDLCAIELLPQLAKSGVTSFKIEGRMKQAEYAAGVVSIYRKYMDRYQNYGEGEYSVSEQDQKKLFDLGNRSGFTEGYYRQKNGKDMITFEKSAHESGHADMREDAREAKEKICGSMTAKEGVPAELSVSFGDVSVTVTGEAPQAAKNQPLTEEELRKRLFKTGNTPFVFDELDIRLEPGLFLSVTAVNSLRRLAIEKLTERALARFRRTARACGEQEAFAGESGQASARKVFAKEELGGERGRNQLKLTASVETEEQILPLMENPLISAIYIDSSVFTRTKTVTGFHAAAASIRAAGKKIYYILPAIFRGHTANFYQSALRQIDADGFLAKSYDALGFLLERGISPEKIRLDYSLPAWSNESRAAFFALGIGGDTVPLELNQNELRQRENKGSEMLVYGRLPLMTSAQCVRKNISHCGHDSGICYLKDRYGVFFPVKNNCNECYNVIYNSRPLALFPLFDKLAGLGIERARLSFTTESPRQVKEVLESFGHLPADGEYTYGHFKRGVE